MAKTTTSVRSQLKSNNSWFDSLSSVKKDLVCIGVLYAIMLVMFHKIIFENMMFSNSGDTTAAQGISKGLQHLTSTEGSAPLWSPYIFSGMPVFAFLMFPHDVSYLQWFLQTIIGKPLFFFADWGWMVTHYFLAGVFMYLAARTLKFGQLASLLSALTFMLNPYAIGLAITGHGSKLMALSYIPMVFMLAYLLCERRDILSTGLLAAGAGTLLLSKHPQIAFYGLLLIGGYVCSYAVLNMKKQPRQVLVTVGLFAFAMGIGLAMSAYEYLPIQEYSHYSIRGGGEGGASAGLDYAYATNWSFHPFEMMNYFIPSFFGFANQYYWGWMPFTDSTVYVGIVPLMLAIIALVYNRNRMTWFLLFASIIMFFMSFGKHFSLLYDAMFNYFPYFNKFRVPVMVLHLMPFTLGLLAAYGYTVITETHNKSLNLPDPIKLQKQFKTLAIILGAILVIGLIGQTAIKEFLSSFMFVKEGELTELRRQYGAQAQQALLMFKDVRFELLWKDFIKFAIVSLAIIGLCILYLKKSIQKTLFTFAILLVLVIDLWILDARYIEPVPQSDYEAQMSPDPLIQHLQAEGDTALFRVMPAGGLFQNNNLMYHHIQSVGGYSPAKIKIYQEMLDSCVFRGNQNILDMLNAKYILFQQQDANGSAQTIPQLNPTYLQRAWIVDSLVIAKNKGDIFSQLNKQEFNPRRYAILEKAPDVKVEKADSSSVRITKYSSSRIELSAYSSSTAALVLSEVYYPAGWKAFIDNQETPIYKTNYILRSIMMPPGAHSIEFVFDPPTYNVGYTISLSAWGITGLLLIAGLFRQPHIRALMNRKKEG